MASLAEVREELNAKRKVLADVFAEAGAELDMDKVTTIRGTTEEKVGQIRTMNKELTALGQEEERLALIEQIGLSNKTEYDRLNKPVREPIHHGGSNGNGAVKLWTPSRLRETLIDHKMYQAFKGGHVNTVKIDIPGLDLKTLITLSTISPQADRQMPVDMGLEERTVADLMLQGTTNSNTVDYYEETTFTNAAAETAEGSAYPESALAWTLRTENVRDIGHFIPATRDSLDDVAFLESTMRGRLAFGVRRREELQLLVGDGTAPNISGILDRSGIQTQAKGADPGPDAVYKGIQKVRGAAGSGFAEPTAVVFHPNDWTDIRLLRTADGIYIWGNPSDAGPERIWGLPIRQTTALTENTVLVGAFRPHAEIFRRTGITVTLSTEHSTFFTERKVAVMAEERLALAIYRPSAFCTVTGM